MLWQPDFFTFPGLKYEYVWMGEFGEMDNYRWGEVNMSGDSNDDQDILPI